MTTARHEPVIASDSAIDASPIPLPMALPPALQSTRSLLETLRVLLRLNIHISGRHHLRSGDPTLFVCNHFTRLETAIMPWVLYDCTGRIVGSLADRDLFAGAFGQWLRAVHVLPTDDPDRDTRIVHDLATGCEDWVIYPEGWMVKSRRVIDHGELCIDVPSGLEPRFPHTGAAVLALRAAMVRRQMRRYRIGNDLAGLQRLRAELGVESIDDLAATGPRMVPVTITYYPLRPGDNAILRLAQTLHKGLPRRLVEELSVEGSMLTRDTDLHIHFGEPIAIDDFLDDFSRTRPAVCPGDESGDADCIDQARWLLTERAVRRIYHGLTINLDHLVALGLRLLADGDGRISRQRFQEAMLLTALELRRRGHNVHHTLTRDICQVAIDRTWAPFADILATAVADGSLQDTGIELVVDGERLSRPTHFHSVRLDHPLSVIANEAEAVPDVAEVLKRYLAHDHDRRGLELLTGVIAHDRRLHRISFLRHRAPDADLHDGRGAPRLLWPDGLAMDAATHTPQAQVGVVLCHGYLSVPAEVQQLGDRLRAAGHPVYLPRLAGHGTGHADLAGTDWEDWYASFVRGIVALHQCCGRVVAAGFSTGGLVALMAAAKLPHVVDGLVTINAPLSLRDKRTRLARWVEHGNRVLDILGLRPLLDTVINVPENPRWNYATNPIHGIAELEELMSVARSAAAAVHAPSLLIQASGDPVVHARSLRQMRSALCNSHVRDVVVIADRHGICCDPWLDDLTHMISDFLGHLPLGVEPANPLEAA